MERRKRQIIKTRPQRPYIIARIIVVIVVALLVLAAVMLFYRPHPGHGAVEFIRSREAWSARVYSAVWQEAPLAERKVSNQASLGHIAHENIH